VVSGSILRGNPDRNSDLDIYVIHRQPFRRRIQKYFIGVPCELFLNNFAQVYQYFEQECKDNRPVTAHMLASGQVIRGAGDPELQELIHAAHGFLTRSPG